MVVGDGGGRSMAVVVAVVVDGGGRGGFGGGRRLKARATSSVVKAVKIVHVVALMTNHVVNVQHLGEDRPRREFNPDRPRRRKVVSRPSKA